MFGCSLPVPAEKYVNYRILRRKVRALYDVFTKELYEISDKLYMPPAEKTIGLLARDMTNNIVDLTPGMVVIPDVQPELYIAELMF